MASDPVGPGPHFDAALTPGNDRGNDAGAPSLKVWIEPDANAPSGFGRIMMSFDGASSAPEPSNGFSFLGSLLGILTPASPRLSGNIAVSSKSAANDNKIWVGSDESNLDQGGGQHGGVFGSDVDAATLASGHTVVAWIGDDHRVHAKAYPPQGGGAAGDGASGLTDLDKALADLGEAGLAQPAGAGRLRLQSLGQNGFAALWVADFGLTAALMGKTFMLAPESASAGGDGHDVPAAAWTVTQLPTVPVPRGTAGLTITPQPGGTLSVSYESGAALDGGEIHNAVFNVSSGEESDGAAPLLAPLKLAALSTGEDAVTSEAAELVPVTQSSATPIGTGSEASAGDGQGSGGATMSSTPDEAGAPGDGGAESLPGGDASLLAGDAAQTPIPESDVGVANAGTSVIGIDNAPAPGAAAVGSPVVHHVTVTGAGDGVPQSAPQVVVTSAGTPVVIHERPAAEPGKTELVLTALDGDGQPIVDADGTVRETIVTDKAVTSDPDAPNLDLAPAICTADTGTAVAWAEAYEQDGHRVVEIKLQIFDNDGHAETGEPITVAAADPGATVSDFAIGDLRRSGYDNHHEASHDGYGTASQGEADAAGSLPDTGVAAPDDALGGTSTPVVQDSTAPETAPETAFALPDAAPVSEPQIAAVWVQNADSHGYGEIMGQRFIIEVAPAAAAADEEHSQNTGQDNHDGSESAAQTELVLVAVGLDGSETDGANAAFYVPSGDGNSDNSGGVPETGHVIGRAPMVAGAGGDAIVIGWVQESRPGSGVEVVDGVVVNAQGGTALLAFDLTALRPTGVLKDTTPSITTSDAGDIVISWLQVDADNGYDAAAAVYRHLGSGQWSVPTQAFLLSHFNDPPKGFSIALSGGDDPTITLTWKSGSRSITGETFDLDGVAAGDGFTHRSSDRSSNSDEGSTDTDLSGLGSAMAPDGTLIVVFTQNEGGDQSIGALVVTAPDQHDSSGKGDGEQTGDVAVTVVIDLEVARPPVIEEPASGGEGAQTSADAVSSADPAAESDTGATQIVAAAAVTADAVGDAVPGGSETVEPAIVSSSSDGSQLSAEAGHASGTSSEGCEEGEAVSDHAAPPVLAIWLPSQVAESDSDSDQIRFVSNETSSDGSGSSGRGGSDHSEDRTAGHCTAADDGDDAEEVRTGGERDDESDSDDCNGFSSLSGSNDNFGDSSSGVHGSSHFGRSAGESFLFVRGYGNEIADYHNETEIFEDAGGEALPEVFDALQFANALSEAGNMEVMTFDASNIVMIRDFETL